MWVVHLLLLFPITNTPEKTGVRQAALASRMTKPTILQFWDANPPDYISQLLATVQSNNPEFGYELFNDERACSYIEAHYGNDMVAVYKACALPSMRADLFRYFFLLHQGGMYIDADFHCTRPLDGLTEKGSAGCLYSHKGGITNSMLFVRNTGDPLMERVLERCANEHQKPYIKQCLGSNRTRYFSTAAWQRTISLNVRAVWDR